MITAKEKDLTIKLLTEKLERISGKKVTFKESYQEEIKDLNKETPITEAPEYAENDPLRDQKRVLDIVAKSNGDLNKVEQLAIQMKNSIKEPSKLEARKREALQALGYYLRSNFSARAYLEIYRIFAGA